LVDFDVVDESNLQRQIAHFTSDVGRPKVESAKDKILGINPFLKVNLHGDGITRDNVREIVAQYDIIVDGTDNFPTRYLVNDACVLEGKPLVYASIFQFEGQITIFHHQDGPCYRCLYPEPPPPGFAPSCAEGGVLGVLPGVIGVIQATEAIKLVLEMGESLSGRLLIYNAMNMKFNEVKLRRDKNCPACGDNPTIGDVTAYEQFCGLPPSEIKEEEKPMNDYDITPKQLKEMWDANPDLFVVDVREGHELEICKLKGTVHIPLGDIGERYSEIPQDRDVVVHCKLGGRSGKAVEFLKGKGYTNCKNLAGGIIQWADDIDNSLKKY
ncbi:MAG: ThiF family adenylyltransferase, partial [Nitrospinae bacterium]|nr:ThiF family adenylyltransferase [Nitrospinota bacterium]